jgi:PIN domain nuclease of toxin-antitoxin system
MRLLLDTHVLLWWLADEPRLTRPQTQALDRASAAGEPFGVSAISFWEIAKLIERGRLDLPRSLDQFFDEIEEHPDVRLLPLSPRISIESTLLGARFHHDPADQIIAATARVHGLRLVTADERIRDSGVVAIV